MLEMYELEKMTTEEAKKALKDVKVGIIPVGSTEQHSGHMTMNTDSVLAYRLALRIAEKMHPDLLVLPTIPVGISYHHMDYPGSMTLSADTLQHIVKDYVSSMRKHGLNRFILFNGHGGNQSALSVCSTTLHHEYGVNIANLFYWNMIKAELDKQIPSDFYGHACEAEVSFGLYLDSDIVRTEKLRPSRIHGFPYRYSMLEHGSGVDVPFSWKEITEDGSFGDARNASLELGKTMIETALERIECFLQDFMNSEVK